MENKKEKGSLTLEMALVLPIFIILMLCVYGIFSINSTKSIMTHALVESTKSLSLDPYYTERSVSGDGILPWATIGDLFKAIMSLDNNKYYTSSKPWYESADGNAEVARDRFVGYLAGGDEARAKEICESMNIVGGLDGVNFKMAVNGEDVSMTIEYEIQYWFDMFDLGKIPVKQTVKSHLWKTK